MTVLIGERYRPDLAESLAAQGIEAFWLPDDPALDKRLAGHADLSLFRAGRHIFAAEEIVSIIVSFLTNRGYTVSAVSGLGGTYPRDVPLCICATGDYTICDPRTADARAVAAAGGIPVHVRQGYARCAAAIVDEQSIITADAGVSRAAKKAGMDVLDIAPGHIITGKLDEHPDGERIVRFVAEHGKKPIFLTDRPVFDIGSAIPL